VPGMSPGAFTVFSRVLSAGVPAQALHEAVRAGKVRASDLPEMIASVWTRDDSPTTGLSEAGWAEIFRAAGFFSYPPLAVRQPDGSWVPLGRPVAPVTLYRGSSPERKRRMSWASEPSWRKNSGRGTRTSTRRRFTRLRSRRTRSWHTWNAATRAGQSWLTQRD
jgi:hypothetical protein